MLSIVCQQHVLYTHLLSVALQMCQPACVRYSDMHHDRVYQYSERCILSGSVEVSQSLRTCCSNSDNKL
jgi:hypothetical protein